MPLHNTEMLVNRMLNVIEQGDIAKEKVYQLRHVVSDSFASASKKNSPLNVLDELERLANLLPLDFYFDRHTLMTDKLTNTLIIRHIDFTSKGRGGLDFQLERCYSSFLAHDLIWRKKVQESVVDFYKEMRLSIESHGFKEDIDAYLYNKFKLLLIEAREITNTYSGQPEYSGPSYEDVDLYPNIFALKRLDNVSDYQKEIRFCPPELWLAFTESKELRFHSELNPSNPTVLIPPGVVPPLVAVISCLNFIYNDIETLIESAISHLEEAIEQCEESTERVVEESADLGIGWYFDIPYIRFDTDLDTGIVCLGGLQENEYNGEDERRYLQYKSILRRVSAFPALKLLAQRFLEQHKDMKQEEIDSLEFCIINSKNQHIYFDLAGKIRFIADRTHFNTIRFEYKDDRISRITDALGYSYDWNYHHGGLLRSIESSKGEKAEYFYREWLMDESIGDDKINILVQVSDGKYSTNYSYKKFEVFSCSSSPAVLLPLIESEVNPLQGEHSVKYADSEEDRYDLDLDFGFGQSKHWWYLLKYRAYSVKSIQRGSQLIILHTRIEEEDGTTTTRAIYPDRMEEYVFYDTGITTINGDSFIEPMLHMRRIYSLKNRECLSPNTDPGAFEDYTDQPIKEETYRYEQNGLLASVRSIQGDVIDCHYALKTAYIYPTDDYIRDAYGLPSDIILLLEREDGSNLNLWHTSFTYISPEPLIDSVRDNLKHKRFSYHTPEDSSKILSDVKRDPGGCRKPLIATEISETPTEEISSYRKYDKYGNLIEVEDGEGNITVYDYAIHNNQPSAVLHKEIRKGKKDVIISYFQYDDSGRLSSITDAQGREHRKTFDEFGRLVEICYPDGGNTTFDYQKRGTIIRKKVDANNELVTVLHSDDYSNLIEVVNRSDCITTRIDFDEMQRVQKVERETGAISSYKYDLLGRLIETVNERGGITKIAFDDSLKKRNIQGEELICRTINVTSPLDEHTVFYYNPLGRLIAVAKDAGSEEVDEGSVWVYCWDSKGRLEREINPIGKHVLYDYDGFDRIRIRTMFLMQPIGPTEVTEEWFKYNDNNQLIKYQDPEGILTEFTYDRFNRIAKILYPKDNTINLHYYPDGRIHYLERNARTVLYEYDDRGNTISLRDPLGYITEQRYDLIKRLSFIRNALGQKTYIKHVHSTDGHTVIVNEHGKPKSSRSYDKNGRLSKKIGERGLISLKEYNTDPQGNRTTVNTLKALHYYCYDFDFLGRVTDFSVFSKEGDHLFGVYQQFTSDGKKRSLSANGSKPWTYEYDKIGRTLRITSPDGRKLEYEYDFRNRLTSVKNGNHVKKFQYNRNGQLTSYVSDTTETLFHRNELGRLQEVIRKYNSQPEMSIGITYDPEEHWARIRDTSGRFVYLELDKNGRVIKLIDQQGLTTITKYNGLGQITFVGKGGLVDERSYYPTGQLQAVKAGGEVKCEFKYDPSGNLSSIIDSEGLSTEFLYEDVWEKPTRIDFPDKASVRIEYDFLGRAVRIEEGKRIIHITRNDRNREVFIETENPEIPCDRVHSRTARIRKSYSPEGNLVRIVRYYGKFSSETSYDYDENNRLFVVTFTISDKEKHFYKYNYDELGHLSGYDTGILNLTGISSKPAQETVLYNSDGTIDEVTDSLGKRKFNYYENGKLSSIHLGDEYISRFNYLWNGQLKRVEYLKNSGQSQRIVKKYSYDSAGILRLVREGENSIAFERDRQGRVVHEDVNVQGKCISNTLEYYSNNIVKSITTRTIKGGTLTERATETCIKYKYTQRKISEIVALRKTGNYFLFKDGLTKEELEELKTLQIPDKLEESAVQFGYDHVGRLSSVKSDSGYLQEVWHYPDGNIKALIIPGQESLRLFYDDQNNPVKVVQTDLIKMNHKTWQYKYNQKGQLERLIDSDGIPFEYFYDLAGNIILVKVGEEKVSIALEKRYNWAKLYESYRDQISDPSDLIRIIERSYLVKRMFDWSNRLVRIERYSYDSHTLKIKIESKDVEYDSAGNVVRIEDSIGHCRKYEYDAAGRLVSVEEDEKEVSSLVYDPLDRLVKDTSDSLIVELHFAGLVPVRTSIEENLRIIIPSPWHDSPFMFIDEGSAILPSWLMGNCYSLYDSEGSLLGKQERLPYGDEEEGEKQLNPFGFKGYYKLAGSNLRWAFSRFYDPENLLFLSQDALRGTPENPISMNRYRLFSCNPLKYYDSYGLSDHSDDIGPIELSIDPPVVPPMSPDDETSDSENYDEYEDCFDFEMEQMDDEILVNITKMDMECFFEQMGIPFTRETPNSSNMPSIQDSNINELPNSFSGSSWQDVDFSETPNTIGVVSGSARIINRSSLRQMIGEGVILKRQPKVQIKAITGSARVIKRKQRGTSVHALPRPIRILRRSPDLGVHIPDSFASMDSNPWITRTENPRDDDAIITDIAQMLTQRLGFEFSVGVSIETGFYTPMGGGGGALNLQYFPTEGVVIPYAVVTKKKTMNHLSLGFGVSFNYAIASLEHNSMDWEGTFIEELFELGKKGISIGAGWFASKGNPLGWQGLTGSQSLGLGFSGKSIDARPSLFPFQYSRGESTYIHEKYLPLSRVLNYIQGIEPH